MPSEKRHKDGLIANEEQVRNADMSAYGKALDATTVYEEMYWYTAVFHQSSGNPYGTDMAAKIARELLWQFERHHPVVNMTIEEIDDRILIGADRKTRNAVEGAEYLFNKRTGTNPLLPTSDTTEHQMEGLQGQLFTDFILLLEDLVTACTTDYQLRRLAYLIVRCDLDKYLDIAELASLAPLKDLVSEIYMMKDEGTFNKESFIGGTYHQQWKAKQELKDIAKKLSED